MNNQDIIDALLENQQRALESGNPPFAAVIECRGDIIASVANDSRTTGNPLRHAEMRAIQMVIDNGDPSILRDSHLYSSNEPCPMCVGACVWAGIRHVTYFLAQEQIRAIRGWGRFISAQAVATADDSGICVTGPIENEDMLHIHERFWIRPENAGCKHSIHLSR